MAKPRILIQLDPDIQPSVFDSVVAVDAEVDHLFRHANVQPAEVESLVHGAIFTRGPQDLKNTAIFVGGNSVAKAEQILEKIKKTFFGPMQVSVMLDANGCNTTAAAAVLCAEKHGPLVGQSIAVLGGTGPVGLRIAKLAARNGARVQLGSRSLDRAEQVCRELLKLQPDWDVTPFSTQENGWENTLSGTRVLFGAGAAGVQLIDTPQLEKVPAKVLVDLNAVPPAGIAGVDVMASGTEINDRIAYGAIGVGGLKMKIHKHCLKQLFESNNLVLDAEEIYDVGKCI